MEPETPVTIPTWGYKPDGSAEIFDLAPGESLPDGWQASPDCITDPAYATAEALTARAAGRAYEPPVALVVGAAEPIADRFAELEAAIAENERLKGVIVAGTAENARLVEEIEKAEGELDAAAGQIVSLKDLLEKAQADGGFAVSEKDAALARIDELAAELTQVRADLDEATKPAEPKPAEAPRAGKAAK